MKIRIRLTLWFAAVLVLSLFAMGALSYYELVIEPRNKARAQASGTKLEQATEDPPGEELLEALAWCGVPALVLGLGGGWWLMRRALAPVAALTEAAEQINEHTLNKSLARTCNGDELDRLTEVFNSMTERLHQSFTRIREFTLHASHELKTPLTVMHGELETALQNETLSPPQRSRIESQLDEVQRLTRIVDGLTLLTKAGAGQIVLAREQVQLDELVREAFADAQNLARPGQIAVNLKNCETAAVLGDRHRLRQLLLNLTDNAIKYNQPQGTVTLSLRRLGENAEVSIVNSGPGIAPELLPRVFDPFFRGDSSHSQTVEGCGLGLSIARWIVISHSGAIEITSRPGDATTAIVRLPICQNGS
jgi:signal transduction histidine kinase